MMLITFPAESPTVERRPRSRSQWSCCLTAEDCNNIWILYYVFPVCTHMLGYITIYNDDIVGAGHSAYRKCVHLSPRHEMTYILPTNLNTELWSFLRSTNPSPYQPYRRIIYYYVSLL